MAPTTVSTRILVLSDTHGHPLPSLPRSAPIDLVLHCGDLTDESKLDEYHTTLTLLKSISAPLKLVIAGNHDFTLEDAVFREKLREAGLSEEDESVVKEYGSVGKARKLLEDARQEGIILLEEGNHEFVLSNGARLRLFASPYTPGNAGWAFQYRTGEGHDFGIAPDTDIVVTHGPPHGILDRTNDGGRRAGCPDLFKAVAKRRPLVHCFGHIHEGWGARRVRWNGALLDCGIEEANHFNAIDHDGSRTVQALKDVDGEKRETYDGDGFVQIDANDVRKGMETLFVNASIEGTQGCVGQWPWLVELNLHANIECEHR